MLLPRLIPLALLLCSLSVFAQNQPPAPSEPWRIIPADPAKAGPPQDPLGQLHSNPDRRYKFNSGQDVIPYLIPDGRTDMIVVSPDGQFLAENICYAIRSYLVAPDEKDADSTHPVKSSTCQPATRYHVKNAEARDSSDR